MTNDKQRLVELLEESNNYAFQTIENNCCEEKLKLLDKVNEIRADYLLANGVIVPPCKVGDTVYVLEDWGYEKELEEKEVDVIAIAGTDDFSKELWEDVYGGVIGTFSDVGKTVFLSKEEAEQALNNIQNENSCEGGAANYLMFRYMFPMPGEFFKATDSDGSVGTVGTPINMEKDM